MTTLGTHPFIPAASRLGAPILCQKCRHDAVDPVHDWLTTAPLVDKEKIARVAVSIANQSGPNWGALQIVCDAYNAKDDFSPMTPEEMVMLPNLFTAEEWAERDAQQPDSSQQPVEDIDGYCVRLNQQVRDIQNGGR